MLKDFLEVLVHVNGNLIQAMEENSEGRLLLPFVLFARFSLLLRLIRKSVADHLTILERGWYPELMQQSNQPSGNGSKKRHER